METKFIKYKPEQINLANIFGSSVSKPLTEGDIQRGTLIIGSDYKGNYLAMGYLRGMTQSKDTGAILYEIANAIEGIDYVTCIQKPRVVQASYIPYVGAKTSTSCPIIGRVLSCNGDKTEVYSDEETYIIDVDFIFELTPYFKETN